MEPGFVVIVCVAYFLVFGSFASNIAEAKGHDPVSWAIGGVFLGPIALLASVGLPDLKLRKYLRLIAEKQGVDMSGEPGVVHKSKVAPYDYNYWEKNQQEPKP
jgi:hypothetical protein